MALELIEIKDFPRTTSVTGSGDELIVVSKADGKTYGIKTSDFKAFLGTVQVTAPKPLSPTDPAPTLDGVYIPTVTQNEAGTPIVYTNAGGLTVNTAVGGADYGNKVEFIKNGSVWVKSYYPLPQSENKIDNWVAGTYINEAQVIYDGEIWQLNAGQTAIASDIPGVSTKWEQVLDYDKGMYKKIENKVKNGDFENGLNEWTLSGSHTPVLDTSNSFFGNNSLLIDTQIETSIAYQDIDFPNGDIIYISAYANNAKAIAEPRFVKIADKGGNTNVRYMPVQMSSLNKWDRFSQNIIVSGGGIRLSLGQSNNTSEKLFFDGIMAVNLTEVFGAGKEPSNLDFEKKYLKNINDGFFDGEVPLVNLTDLSENKLDIDVYKGLDVFSKSDLINYPILRLFNKIELDLDTNIYSLSIIQIEYIGTRLAVVFNANDEVNGANWRQNFIVYLSESVNPDIYTATEVAGSVPFVTSKISIEFDYSKYSRKLDLKVMSNAIDKRIQINQSLIDELTGKEGSLSFVKKASEDNKRAILGELPFSKKDYINYPFLSLIKEFRLEDISPDLFSFGIISFNKIANKIQVIFNENDVNNGTTYNQSLVLEADVSSNPDTVILQGRREPNGKVTVYMEFDYSKWQQSFSYDGQYLSADNKIDYPIEGDSNQEIDKNYDTFSNLMIGVNRVGDYGYLGDLKFKRIDTGNTEASFKRCFHYMVPNTPKFPIVDYAEGFTRNIVDMTDDGMIRAFFLQRSWIVGFNSIDDLKDGQQTETQVLLYNLPVMNPDFLGQIRWFYQLDNRRILVYELTLDEDHLGGLWIIDEEANTLTKTFTFLNKYHINAYHWNIEIKNNMIFFAEYGKNEGGSDFGDGTRLWRSMDNGSSWTEVYDFKNLPNIYLNGYHNHGVHYDMHWDRIWITSGDRTSNGGDISSKRLTWSDDQGVTWDSLDLGFYFDKVPGYDNLNNAQCLSMFSTKDFLLLGGDDYNNGIYRVAKVSKTEKPVLELVYRYDDRYNDRITQFTTRWQRLSNGLIVVTLRNGDSTPTRSRLMGTYDGIKWFELWSGKETNLTLGGNDMGFTENNGYLYMQTQDFNELDERVFKYIKFKIPKMV